MTQTPPSLPIY